MTKPSFCRLLCFGSIALCNACSNTPVIDSDLGIKGAPAWVNKVTFADRDNDKPVIYAVGSVPPMGDLSFQIATASDRARGLIARELAYGIGDAASNTSEATNGSAKHTAIHRAERSMHSLAIQSLAGSRIVGQWRDPASQEVFILVELDLTRAATLAALRGPEDREAFARYSQRVLDHLTGLMMPALSSSVH